MIGAPSVGLLRVSNNPKTGVFEVAHGQKTPDETSIGRIWKVVGNRADQMVSPSNSGSSEQQSQPSQFTVSV